MHTEPAKIPDEALHTLPQFGCTSHDDIFSIIARIKAVQFFAGDESPAFVVGLKLFSKIMLTHSDDPLFAPVQGAFGEFMKGLKARTKPAI